MNSSIRIYTKSISFGITFTIFTAYLTKMKQNTLALSMKLEFALIPDKMIKLISDGFHLEVMKPIPMPIK